MRRKLMTLDLLVDSNDFMPSFCWCSTYVIFYYVPPCFDLLKVLFSNLNPTWMLIRRIWKLWKTCLSRLTTDEKLQETFSSFGQLIEAKVITDRASGRSKGFAFVTYATIEEAEKAREGMNAKFLDGWVIFVDPAKPREPRPPPQQSQSQPSETGFTVNKTIGWTG
ncbi:hypothetical protein TanjilG_26977 [Lupinus angustifolius]|uniref:RRM domain-containing protein n=1 Tax=Lupinus angustifolius TaxID=3871 RepID=A0A1J7FVY0_LUPAN|nr:hypothetical protein TanjilG_26977 [Lupinus angustifolius]